jgi:hypothetical protein
LITGVENWESPGRVTTVKHRLQSLFPDMDEKVSPGVFHESLLAPIRP